VDSTEPPAADPIGCAATTVSSLLRRIFFLGTLTSEPVPAKMAAVSVVRSSVSVSVNSSNRSLALKNLRSKCDQFFSKTNLFFLNTVRNFIYLGYGIYIKI
jgi:hypothetical protein